MADDERPIFNPSASGLKGAWPNIAAHLGLAGDPDREQFVPTSVAQSGAVQSAIESMDLEPDDSPQRTAENTEAMTEHLAALTTVMREQAQLVAEQVALSKETLRTAEQAERRANRTGWSSLAVAVISLGTSIAALFVAR